MIKIAIDALGGDNGVDTTVKGSMLAIQEFKDIEIILYGDIDKINPLLTNKERISIVDTKVQVSMGEKDPVKAIRTLKDSSLVMALKAGKDKEVDAVVTAGPTQCVVVGAHLIVKKLPQMSRIALCPIMPNFDGNPRLLLDVGANVELRPEHINELALFASITAECALNIKNPKVGLLNIGSEPGKGREVDKETFILLSQNKNINFYGNVETFDIVDSPVDVMITDGFSGNMVMKTMEGTGKTMAKMLKQEIKSSLGGKIGYLFMRKNLARFAKRMDSKEVGGAMILGIGTPVVKAHGNSNDYAFKNAIKQVRNMVSNDLINKVTALLPSTEDKE